jgi:hypothetical protein
MLVGIPVGSAKNSNAFSTMHSFVKGIVAENVVDEMNKPLHFHPLMEISDAELNADAFTKEANRIRTNVNSMLNTTLLASCNAMLKYLPNIWGYIVKATNGAVPPPSKGVIEYMETFNLLSSTTEWAEFRVVALYWLRIVLEICKAIDLHRERMIHVFVEHSLCIVEAQRVPETRVRFVYMIMSHMTVLMSNEISMEYRKSIIAEYAKVFGDALFELDWVNVDVKADSRLFGILTENRTNFDIALATKNFAWLRETLLGAPTSPTVMRAWHLGLSYSNLMAADVLVPRIEDIKKLDSMLSPDHKSANVSYEKSDDLMQGIGMIGAITEHIVKNSRRNFGKHAVTDFRVISDALTELHMHRTPTNINELDGIVKTRLGLGLLEIIDMLDFAGVNLYRSELEQMLREENELQTPINGGVEEDLAATQKLMRTEQDKVETLRGLIARWKKANRITDQNRLFLRRWAQAVREDVESEMDKEQLVQELKLNSADVLDTYTAYVREKNEAQTKLIELRKRLGGGSTRYFGQSKVAELEGHRAEAVEQSARLLYNLMNELERETGIRQKDNANALLLLQWFETTGQYKKPEKIASLLNEQFGFLEGRLSDGKVWFDRLEAANDAKVKAEGLQRAKNAYLNKTKTWHTIFSWILFIVLSFFIIWLTKYIFLDYLPTAFNLINNDASVVVAEQQYIPESANQTPNPGNRPWVPPPESGPDYVFYRMPLNFAKRSASWVARNVLKFEYADTSDVTAENYYRYGFTRFWEEVTNDNYLNVMGMGVVYHAAGYAAYQGFQMLWAFSNMAVGYYGELFVRGDLTAANSHLPKYYIAQGNFVTNLGWVAYRYLSLHMRRTSVEGSIVMAVAPMFLGAFGFAGAVITGRARQFGEDVGYAQLEYAQNVFPNRDQFESQRTVYGRAIRAVQVKDEEPVLQLEDVKRPKKEALPPVEKEEEEEETALERMRRFARMPTLRRKN